MKIPVLELGNEEKKDSAFLPKGTNGIALILHYNIDELIKLAKGVKK